MSNIVPFIFENHQVRVLTDANGKALFVAKDVAEALGYANPSEAITRHCKGVAERYPLQTAGGTQEVRVIRESDLYRLIFGSNLPSAEAFERLVVEEILPSVRETGSYSTAKTPGEALVEMAQNFLSHERMLAVQGRQIAELASQQAETRAQVSALVEGEGFLTIVGWAKNNHLSVDIQTAARLGSAATKACRERGITPGKALHPVFGQVNSYPKELLDDLFSEIA